MGCSSLTGKHSKTKTSKMFKIIHSNRDPRDTLYSELKKEFSVYVDKGNSVFTNLICSYPRFVFALMITLLTASLIVAVMLHHKMPPKDKVSKNSSVRKSPVNDSFDNIMAAGTALK